jgi:6-phosphogluconolactonase
VSFQIEVLDDFAGDAAQRIAGALGAARTLVLTGGSTAAQVYPLLAAVEPDLSGKQIFFSDERCVPPDHPDSNYGMARRTLLEDDAAEVHRMQGEIEPARAAELYSDEVAAVDSFDLVLLGMGADCHVCALFPGSPALGSSHECAAVDRPDGLKGLTLTPFALEKARKILLLVSGGSKAAAVRRVITGDDFIGECPARLFADHPDATFLLDSQAAAEL